VDEQARILTIDELAKYLKVGKTTLYRLAQEGKIPGQKVGKHWRFNRESIDRWLEENKRTTEMEEDAE
jgi:excisionase family DNA binding protein